jgi:hypothetical protein
MAFSDDLLAVGNYHGFNLYRLAADGSPQLMSSVICPGGQGDMSIVGNLLIMSVEQTRARVDCGLQGVSQDVSPERFRGIRIFDITDRTRPRQVGQVQTCRGSHTHSVVSTTGGSIIVYVSGTAQVRKPEELPGCVAEAADPRTALFRIDVVEIPMAHPEQARIIDSPAVFADHGDLAGLWRGGAHGEGTQETSRTDQCHDITVFPSRSLAAGACSGNGIIFDIADPRKPRRIDVVSDPTFSYWHSATFNNDGSKVIFTDEWGGGGRPAAVSRPYQAAGDPDRPGELRRAQRLDHPGSGPRYLRPGLVPGRYFGDGLHRFSAPDRDRLFRPGADQRRHNDPRRLLVRLLVSRPHLRHRDRARSRCVRSDAWPADDGE